MVILIRILKLLSFLRQTFCMSLGLDGNKLTQLLLPILLITLLRDKYACCGFFNVSNEKQSPNFNTVTE